MYMISMLKSSNAPVEAPLTSTKTVVPKKKSVPGSANSGSTKVPIVADTDSDCGGEAEPETWVSGSH